MTPQSPHRSPPILGPDSSPNRMWSNRRPSRWNALTMHERAIVISRLHQVQTAITPRAVGWNGVLDIEGDRGACSSPLSIGRSEGDSGPEAQHALPKPYRGKLILRDASDLDRGGGVANHVEHELGLRQHRDVTRLDLVGLRVHAVRDEPLEFGVHGPVLGG